MNHFTEFYPLLWAICALIGAFGGILLDILIDDAKAFIGKRRMKLRDRLHVACTQNRGAV